MNETTVDNSQTERNNFEEYVLGCLIEDSKVRNEYFPKIEAIDFANSIHQKIYLEMYKMFIGSINFTYESLINSCRNEIKDEKSFEKHKVIIYKIVTSYTSSDHLSQYYHILKSFSIKNQLKELGKKLVVSDFKDNDIENVLWQTQTSLLQIMNSDSNSDLVHVKKIGEEVSKKLQILKTRRNEMTGTTSGYTKIDAYTSGFQPGEMIVLAARPSMGKTALAINMALNAAMQCNADEQVVFFSLEMSAEQVYQRLLSVISEVDSKKIKTGDLTEADEYLVSEAMERINRLPIYVDEQSDLNIIDIQSSLKKIVASDKKIKLVIIDYLQLVKGISTSGQQNRQVEVSQISRTLKITAKQIHSPIIAVAQLSRAIESRPTTDRKPMLSDLRESGAIEQDADIVTFIDYERDEKQEGTNPAANNGVMYNEDVMATFYIAKNRSGSTGEVELFFKKKIGKYLEII